MNLTITLRRLVRWPRRRAFRLWSQRSLSANDMWGGALVGGAAGAIIGGVAGDGRGAAIGAVIGGASGAIFGASGRRRLRKPNPMAKALTADIPTLLAPTRSDVPDESFKRVAMAGWVIVGVFFGLFGSWAAIAPLRGAVVANALVKVEGNRKSVQHLEGGIVKEMRVKEGDKVAVGDVLIVLDDSQARAEYEVLTQDFIVRRATESRLRAEPGRRCELAM